MKPIDHPDFFRVPAPPGRSRESSIVLNKDGTFFHDGSLFQHEKMALVFSKWIRRHPDNGRFILENGFDWTYFTVEDVPFFVQSLKTDPNTSEVSMELSDGSQELLLPSNLTEDEQGVLYCLVKNGEFEARFLRAAQLQLAPFLGESDAGVEVRANGVSACPKARAHGG